MKEIEYASGEKRGGQDISAGLEIFTCSVCKRIQAGSTER